jgi:hypothetical protein
MTAQVHETLILDGRRVGMATELPIPEEHARIGRGEDWDRLPITACWRNYVGTWEIDDGLLYLRRLRGKYRVIGREPILADWVTAELRVPRGQVIQAVHGGFATLTEEDLFIAVEAGRVTGERVVRNEAAGGRNRWG